MSDAKPAISLDNAIIELSNVAMQQAEKQKELAKQIEELNDDLSYYKTLSNPLASANKSISPDADQTTGMNMSLGLYNEEEPLKFNLSRAKSLIMSDKHALSKIENAWKEYTPTKEDHDKFVFLLTSVSATELAAARQGEEVKGIRLSEQQLNFFNNSLMGEGFIEPERLEILDCDVDFTPLSPLYAQRRVYSSSIQLPRRVRLPLRKDDNLISTCVPCPKIHTVTESFDVDVENIILNEWAIKSCIRRAEFDYHRYTYLSPTSLYIQEFYRRFITDKENLLIYGSEKDPNMGWLSASETGVGFPKLAVNSSIKTLLYNIVPAILTLPANVRDITIVMHSETYALLWKQVNSNMQVINPIDFVNSVFAGTNINWVKSDLLPRPVFDPADHTKLANNSFIAAIADWRLAYSVFTLKDFFIQRGLGTDLLCETIGAYAAFTGSVLCPNFGRTIWADGSISADQVKTMNKL